MNDIKHPQWAFMWTGENGYITDLIGCNRRELIAEVEDKMERKWRFIYRIGGRIVKIKISVVKEKP